MSQSQTSSPFKKSTTKFDTRSEFDTQTVMTGVFSESPMKNTMGMFGGNIQDIIAQCNVDMQKDKGKAAGNGMD